MPQDEKKYLSTDGLSELILKIKSIVPGELTPEQVQEMWGAISGGPAITVYQDFIGTLTAGSTSLTLSDTSIIQDMTFDVYTNIFGVNPIGVTISEGSITLTFEEQQNDLLVKVRRWY